MHCTRVRTCDPDTALYLPGLISPVLVVLLVRPSFAASLAEIQRLRSLGVQFQCCPILLECPFFIPNV